MRNTYPVSFGREQDYDAPMVGIPRLGGPQHSFLLWSAQIKSSLKAEWVWYVMGVDDAVSLSSWHQVRASDGGSDAGSDSECARDVACLIIL